MPSWVISSGIRPTGVSATGGGSHFCGAWSLHNFWGPLYEKEYRIGYEGGYLFRVPPRTLEGARASEGPRSLSISSFMVSPPLGMMIIQLRGGRQSLSGDRSEHRVERDSLGRLFGSHLHILKWNLCWFGMDVTFSVWGTKYKRLSFCTMLRAITWPVMFLTSFCLLISS